MAKLKPVVYPNYHIPNEDRAILMQPLDEILSSQGLLNIKKIVSLYFTQVLDIEAMEFLKEQGIAIDDDKITLAPWNISRRVYEREYVSRHKGTIETLESMISDSKTEFISLQQKHNGDLSRQELGKAFYDKARTTFTNAFELTPELNRKLTGQVDNYKNRFVFLIESVTLNNDGTVSFRMGSFLKKMRDHLQESIKGGKSIYSDPEIISVNKRALLKFQSPYAAQLYLLIAKNQFYSNHLEISVKDLQEYLGYSKGEVRGWKEFAKRLKLIIEDPGLSTSSCAIKPQVVRGKQVYWVVSARETSRNINKIEFRFQSNADLKQMLLDKPYRFIRHLKDGSLNEATLVQIIARVSDDIIPEAWVNFCVNKAYDYVNQDPKRKKNHKGIGGLVWEYIKANRFRGEFDLHDDLCTVTDDIGLSVSQRNQMITASQVKLPLSADEVTTNKQSVNEKVAWGYFTGLGLPEAYIAYAKAFIPVEYLQKKLRAPISTDSKITAAEHVRKIVLADMHSTFETQIKAYCRAIGFSAEKSNAIHGLMDDFTKELFLEFIHDGKMVFKEDWKEHAMKHFNQLLEKVYKI